MTDILIRNARLPRFSRSPALVDITIAQGRFEAIVPAGGVPAGEGPREDSARRIIDAEGRLVSPPFSDPHLHLDAALSVGDPYYNRSGTLLEGIRIWGDRKKRLSVDDIKRRAYRAVSWEVAQGTAYIRTHADASEPELTTVRALTELREELEGFVDLQVVAFPQDGIYTHSRGEALMEKALDLGADVVGGIPHNELTREDGIRDVGFAFRLASERDLLVDIHCDETDDDQSRFVETVAAETLRNSMPGRVAASHVTAMHSYNNAYAAKLIGNLAKAGVSIIVNPFDNSILQARGDSYPKRRGIARVDELLAAGVTVGVGHDSIMDPWYPLGRGSLLQAANLLLHFAQLSGYDQIFETFRLITEGSAKVLNLDEYGIAPGNPADLIILDASDEFEALRLVPRCLYVLKGGKVIATSEPEEAIVNLPMGEATVDYRRSEWS